LLSAGETPREGENAARLALIVEQKIRQTPNDDGSGELSVDEGKH